MVVTQNLVNTIYRRKDKLMDWLKRNIILLSTLFVLFQFYWIASELNSLQKTYSIIEKDMRYLKSELNELNIKYLERDLKEYR